MRKLLFSCLVLLAMSCSALADTPVIEPLGSMDRIYLDKQVQRIDDMARTQLGMQLRGDLYDLSVLQAIIDRNLIESTDREMLQALGAVMARVLEKDLPVLEWKVYNDALGRSRALCVRETVECLFPITMLSRRMEKGLKPNVRMVYEDAILLLEEYLPKYPYGGGIMRKLHG